jgi:hypothetical protein
MATENNTEGDDNNIVPNKVPTKNEESSVDFITDADGIPQEIKKQIMMMRASSITGTRQHPLFDKFTENHIDKYLDYIQRDDDNEFKFRSSNRWFYLFYVILGIGFFSFLVIYLLPKDKSLLEEILKLIVAYAGGVGSGYGIKSYLNKK